MLIKRGQYGIHEILLSHKLSEYPQECVYIRHMGEVYLRLNMISHKCAEWMRYVPEYKLRYTFCISPMVPLVTIEWQGISKCIFMRATGNQEYILPIDARLRDTGVV